MKLITILFFIPLYALAIMLEGRHIEKNDKCFILVNENQLSERTKLPIQCELSLIDQYKYRYEIEDSKCPYKIKKIKLIAPGVDARPFNHLKKLKKCIGKK